MSTTALDAHNTLVCSLIVTSYNQVKTLQLLFETLKSQTFTQFEVIVADDGSKDETAVFCQKGTWPFRVRFITQEDLGYRKARILNNAIRVAEAHYLIFVDSDVFLDSRFIEDHITLRKPGHFVCGRRVDLPIKVGRIFWWLRCVISRGTNWKRGVRISNPWVRSLLKYDQPIDILGSNLSLWRDDLIAVNGFNEALESYWGEDGDLYARLIHSGRLAIGAKGLCIQFHLHHPRREPNPENIREVEKALARQDYIWAEKGYSSRS